MRKHVEAIDRIMARVYESPGPLDTPCWLTTYRLNKHGYVRVAVGQKTTVVGHRVTYERFVGAIPDGLQIDHLCRDRGCVNPAHLEPVTVAENLRRGNSPSAIVCRTNICQRGHSMEDAHRDREGRRSCRTCKKIRENARAKRVRLRP